MKFLAIFVGFYSSIGLGAVFIATTMQDPRGRPWIFGAATLLMSVAGFRAARSIWRHHAMAERRFYIWGLALTAMMASLGLAFPYAFAQRRDFWLPAINGAALFGLFVVVSGRFIRRRAHAA
jgi:hypothetical protein